jgi:hypothetical protein
MMFVRDRNRIGWLVAGMALLIGTTGLVRAQAFDPQFQGRIMQRSDGALFIYKDGLKYAVQLADVDDDFINSVPDAELPVAQVDQLFAVPPAPLVDAPPPVVLGPPAPPSYPGPYVAVANPSPGDVLQIGGLEIAGKAFDPAAGLDQGPGIDRVQVFLGDRDLGGLHLGDARLGLLNPAAAPGTQFSMAGWGVVVTLPSGAHTIFVYARSWVTGKETTVQVPVKVGTAQ